MSQQINLYSPIFLKQKKYFSSATMLEALALVLAGALAFYGYAWYQVSALVKQAAETEKRLKLEQARLAKLTEEISRRHRDQQLEAEVANLEALVKTRQELVGVLQTGAIGNTQGYSEYMRAFARQSLNGLWLTGFSITGAGDEMELRGRVLTPELVPAYIRRLNREPLLQGKQFVTLQMSLPKEDPAKSKQELRYLEFSLESSGTEKAGSQSKAQGKAQ